LRERGEKAVLETFTGFDIYQVVAKLVACSLE